MKVLPHLTLLYDAADPLQAVRHLPSWGGAGADGPLWVRQNDASLSAGWQDSEVRANHPLGPL